MKILFRQKEIADIKSVKEIEKFIYDKKKLTVKLNLSKINEKLAEEIFQMIELKIKNDLN